MENHNQFDKRFNNCRNCDNRFDCDECKDMKKPIVCDDWTFDEDAATCDDCSKRHDCKDYVKAKVTCAEWQPEVTCDDCNKKSTCENFKEQGTICDRFDEIRYKLTEKGALYLAMEYVRLEDGIYVGTNELMEAGFFETLDHEMRINGLVEERRPTRVGRFFQKLAKPFRKKPKADPKQLFVSVAKRKEFYYYFSFTDKTAEMVYDRFAEMLASLYADK